MPDLLDRYVAKRVTLSPKIYAYSDKDPRHRGFLKVGFTAQDVPVRVGQQFPIKGPDDETPYVVEFAESAVRSDGTTFRDHDLHRVLKKMPNVQSLNGEWFRCTPEDVRAAWIAVRDRIRNVEKRTQDFSMRNEQSEAVKKTKEYFENRKKEGDKAPKFLWNAKMRFGKTFAAYQLAKQMGFRRVLILTFKPAVESAWQEDLRSHVDFEGWQFVSDKEANFVSERLDKAFKNCDQERPIVVFGSFQNLLGTDRNGGIKAKNKFIHELHWDLVIFDEYHFGAWKDNAKRLFKVSDEDTIEEIDLDGSYKKSPTEKLDETWLPITSDHYLYLSGTPFRAIDSGEFIEEQIYNWTYSDEQKAKEEWKKEWGENPYESLPQMVMLTYKVPEEIERIAKQGEFNEFDLNVFFEAKGKGKNARFEYEEYVQKWLKLIRGAYSPATRDELKQGKWKPAMPFSDIRLLSALNHTLWFLPDVASCQAMANLLSQEQNSFYHDYEINVCAGRQVGIGSAALEAVRKSMQDPLKSKTITLSCGKLTTGVTVAPWTGVFMLRNLKRPETYFQTAFRVQSPWVIKDDEGKKVIMKRQCYVFDFAPNRSLKQMADYACRLNVKEHNPEKKVGGFIHFLPVIAYDGSRMEQIDAKAILDFAMSGTSATLLARRWESALLVNVDNDTLWRLMKSDRAMEILNGIEAFRNLRENIEFIINKSDHVKNVKREAAEKEKELTAKKKEELSKEEKEYKSKRKEIQEKLIQLATRIPIFMYLTDCREQCLKDVIVAVEPGLFKKVAGLEIADFELLCELNVFNSSLMNDAVYKFRRYEDASLEYTGINKHKGERIGLFDTALTQEDYAKLGAPYVQYYTEQQKSMKP